MSLFSSVDTDTRYGLEEAKRLTFSLRSLAIGSGWPKYLAIALSVKYKPEVPFYIFYPSQVAQQIEELEFGLSEDNSPNPVIRPFLNDMAGLVSEKYLSDSACYIAESLGDGW